MDLESLSQSVTDNDYSTLLSKLDDVEEPLPYEPERHYLPAENYHFDWNGLLGSSIDENGDIIDWNKLIYNEEQLLEFDLKKQERALRPESYDYMFKKASERTELEKFYLRQSGFCAYDEDSDEDCEEQRIKRFIIDPISFKEKEVTNN